MAAGRLKLIGVALLISGASAQTLNSTIPPTLPAQLEVAVSPALPSSAPGVAELPCSGAGALWWSAPRD
jgi:hypothetical protein